MLIEQDLEASCESDKKLHVARVNDGTLPASIFFFFLNTRESFCRANHDVRVL